MDIVQQLCFDPAYNPNFDPNNSNCKLITRDQQQGTIVNIGSTFLNAGRFRTAGLDVQFDWGVEFADVGVGIPGSFSANVQFNYLDTLTSSVLPTEPLVEYAGTLGPPTTENGLNPGAYRWHTFSTFTYAVGPGTLSLQWDHLPKTKSITAATNPNTPIFGAPAYDLFNLHGTFAVTPGIILRAGVDNILDKDPPIVERNLAPAPGTLAGGSVAAGLGAGRYDILGRRYYVGVQAKF